MVYCHVVNVMGSRKGGRERLDGGLVSFLSCLCLLSPSLLSPLSLSLSLSSSLEIDVRTRRAKRGEREQALHEAYELRCRDDNIYELILRLLWRRDLGKSRSVEIYFSRPTYR
jgi:hypothetical protein